MTDPASRQIGIISRLRNRSTISPLSRCDDQARPQQERQAKPRSMRCAFSASRAGGAKPMPRSAMVCVADAARDELLAHARAGGGFELRTEPRGCDLVHLEERLALAAVVPLDSCRAPPGTVRPNRPASMRTASGKLTFSCSSTNLITSPPTRQPKQWKKPFSRFTWNDGVFSPWNGHSPFHVAPLRLSDTTSPITCTISAFRCRSSRKVCGTATSAGPLAERQLQLAVERSSFSSTTVTPPPPCSSGAVWKLATSGCDLRKPAIAFCSRPVPWP